MKKLWSLLSKDIQFCFVVNTKKKNNKKRTVGHEFCLGCYLSLILFISAGILNVTVAPSLSLQANTVTDRSLPLKRWRKDG